MQTNFKKGSLIRRLLFLLILPIQVLAQFTQGNLTVLQAGDGSTTLVNTGNVIVLKEYSTNGTPTYSMVVPSTGTDALLMSGSATSEGYLSASADGKYLAFGGYAQTLPSTVNLPGATGSTINRCVALVGGLGLPSYSIVASSTSFFSTSNIRAVAANDKNNIWGTGGSQGVNYFGPASTPVNVQNTKTNLRAAAIFNNQLYFSAQVTSGTPTHVGVYTVGNGTPTTSGQTASCIIVSTGTGSGTAQPNQFFFNSQNTICYVADGRTIANGGGIQKWVNSAGTWTLMYTLGTGTNSTAGAFGVVADFSATNPMVYATTSNSGSNRLIAINDTGAASDATTIATAPSSNANFRGLAFSPCSLPQVALSSGSIVCANNQTTLSVNALSPVSSFTWSGIGNFSTPNASLTTVVGAATGIYTLSAENACGVLSETIAITVHPLPQLNPSTVTICSGQPATLTANGADTYTWSNGSNASSIIVNPSSNINYTVSGTTNAGCTNSSIAQVLIATAPSITVNSPTVCAGSVATLVATGVSNYTWSNGMNGSSISVSPSVTTTYTVEGNLNGCPGNATATGIVNVNPTPNLSINGGTSTCQGVAVTLSVTGADSYTWSTSSTATQITVSPTIATTYSVVGKSNDGCVASKSTTITVTGTPPLFITATPTSICAGQTATLIATGASSFNWSAGSSNAAIVVNPQNTTVYTATGTVNSNCKGSINYTLNVTICESIFEELDASKQLTLIPNPSYSMVTIKMKKGQFKTIRITNKLGQVILETASSDDQLLLNISTWPRGVYFVNAFSGTHEARAKMLVE